MSILPFPCGIDGCKKSKLRKHTHFLGDLSRSGADQALIAQLNEFARMRGESVQIPGGTVQDMNMFLKNRVTQEKKAKAKADKENLKKAKEFRDKLAKEKKRR